MNERTGKWRETEGFALSYSSWRTREGRSGFQVWAILGRNYVLWVCWESKLNCKCIAESRGISWKAHAASSGTSGGISPWKVGQALQEAAQGGAGGVQGRIGHGGLLVSSHWAGISPNCFPNFSSRVIRVILAPLAGISHRGHSQKAHPANECSLKVSLF